MTRIQYRSPSGRITILKMNKALILIATSCVLAFVAVQVHSQFYNPYQAQYVQYGQQNTGYSNYLSQLERYNQRQQLKTLTTTTKNLRNSALVGLASLFAISLFATNSTGTLAG